MCSIRQDFDGTYYDHNNKHLYENRFIASYELYNDSFYQVMVKLLYFSSTSLTTIGLGDFHPKADFERVACAFMIFNGVMMFSYISSNLIEIIKNLRDYDKPVGNE
jgi:hypothetical protein